MPATDNRSNFYLKFGSTVVVIVLLFSMSIFDRTVQAQSPPTPAGPTSFVVATLGWEGSLAYNPFQNNWLVTSDGGRDAIYGRIMGNDGQPVMNQFEIMPNQGGVTQQIAPKTVFAADINQYLVVWIGFPLGDAGDPIIYGRFVNPDGTFPGDKFEIFTVAGVEEAYLYTNSILRYDGTNKKFVFVWETRLPSPPNVSLITVDQSGVPGPRIKVTSGGSGFLASWSPSLAINEARNEYCVAYDQRNAGNVVVRRVDALTGALGAEAVLYSNRQNPNATPTDTSIAYNPAANKYLVSWNAGYALSVQGRFINNCSAAGSTTQMFTLKTGIGRPSLSYNSKSNLYGLIGQDWNDIGNTYVVLDANGREVASGTTFTSGAFGNFTPTINANTQDGSFAAISGMDYQLTRFVAGISCGTNCPAPSISPTPTPTPAGGISVINSNIWWPGAGLVKIAFDTVNQVYLAVSGDSGWFFNKDGVPIGNPFKIALENIPNTAWPNVAFGGPATDPTFLVTYVVGDQVTNPKYGRLVRYQAGGSPLIGNRSKIVDVRDSWYTSEKAVLVWSGTKFIVSSPVNLTAGSIGQPYIHSFSMTGVVSAGVSLGDGVNFAVPRGLACATNGICLSVGYTINGAYGRRFNSNTMTLLGSLFYIIDNQSAGNIQDADVVYNSKINKFVTTWARGGAGWADFRIVNLDGSMGPLDLTKSFGPTAGDVKLAYNSGTETTLLLSKLDSSASLYAVELGDNGYPIDPNKKIFLGAWDGIIPGYYPGLAADPVNARWLAMWAWIAGGAGYKGALISGSTSNLVPTPPTVFTTKDLGVGTFPDPVFFNGRVWVAVQQGPPGDYGKLNLYNFATNLTDQRVTQIPFSGVGRAFQRLGVFNNILWMIFRDGENSACAVDPTTCIPERIKLWRSDTGAIEDLGLVVGSGNRPVAIGNGYIAWQNKQDGFLKVFRRPIGGGTPVVLRSGLPTGITRILPSGNVVMYDTDLTAVPWGVSASFAGPLTVATDAYNLPPTIIPGNDNGIVGRFNNDPATQFNIWATERAHDPRAATDSQGYYVVATWNPTVRIAVFTSLGQTVDQIICDPLPTDTEALLECSFNNLLYGTPQTFAPGQDPSNPLELPAAGTWGFDSAYSSSNDRVLVVSTAVLDPIKDLRGIVGFIINPDTMAVEIGPMTIIGQGAQAPMVAYSPDQDRFLVAWEDSRSGDKFNRYVYARFVGVDGTLQGTDFEIRKQNTFLMDLDYDERNKKFVFMLSSGGENFIKTVDANGTVSQDIKVPQLISSEYEGQPTLAVNSNLNQYMVSMVGCINNNDPTLEDCKVGVYRYDVATNSWLGDPIILSQPNLGQNRFGRAEIVYSPIDSRALVVWQENAPANRAGQWGRVIYDNDTIGPEQAILNTNIFPYSSGYGGPHLNYNPWTNTIFNSTEDSDGGSILMEMTTDGSMLNIRQAIAPPDSSVQPYGTFYPNNVVTPQGALALGTQGYAAVVLTSTSSIFEDRSISPTSSQPGTVSPTTPDTTSLPRLINQIYIWSLGIGALLALLMVIFGGYMYMTAAGNAEQASKGVEILWGAIIGLALLFSSYLILRTINPDLVNFSIRSVENLGR